MKKSIAGIFAGLFLVMGSTLSVGADNGDMDCGDFSSHEEVLEFWVANGYGPDNDPHDLDRDNDGLACEVSQSEYDNYIASQDTNGASEGTSEEQEDAEEGAALPNTASNGPLMMLFGAGAAGMGSLLLFRRKKQMA
ncbi:LPXTG cell wall anchor domain-containing protein [Planococcus salinus]|uniref:LPXTG cell wall anchor domain-containing protein n=1 Tax=Planococcus salinus TaxID=1848460 RepID=A0A3M8P5U5_9BACL|nr:excalibur calcium-binding domain-containing protein [Planococcus salinus]RNF39049.1 LPXTG cell wall anchor domain-containing protein [Planococcus salinus]